MATPDEVQKALMAVMPLFANYKPPATPDDVKVFKMAWHRQVGHLDCALLNAALADAAGKTGFFPTPKEVLDSVASITIPQAVSGDEAWNKVVKAIAEFGYNRPPIDMVPPDEQPHVREPWTFADKLTLAIVMDMGWRHLCLDEDETIQWKFIHAYKAAAEREIAAARELPAVTDVRRQVEAARVSQITGAVAAQLTAGNGRHEKA